MSVALVLALCSAGQPSSAFGDEASSAVKAAILYNLAKFAEWPADSRAQDAVLTVCTNDTAIAAELDLSVAGRQVAGHTLRVRRISADSVRVAACHMLYVSSINAAEAQQLIDDLRGTPVLTVSDFERFAEFGGVVQFVVERQRIRFVVNIDAMRRQRVGLSATLLALASIVTDAGPDIRRPR